MFFFADDGVNGVELWKSDGTADGTVLVKDIRVGPAGSEVTPIPFQRVPTSVDLDGALIFAADDGVNGYELWRSDGTAAGTVLVRDIFPGSAASDPRYFTKANGKVFFRALNGATGYELWKTDGTASGTALVRDIFPGPIGSGPGSLTGMGDALLFQRERRHIWR